MTEEENNAEIFTVLRKYGCEEGKGYHFVLTKEMKFEPLQVSSPLDKVLPYPFKTKPASCEVCGKLFAQHSHLDFFVIPEHIRAVRDFIEVLVEKFNRSRNMYQKLGVEAPDSVLSPKDMSLLLLDIAKDSPENIDFTMDVFDYYIPSEHQKFIANFPMSRQLQIIRNHYSGYSRKWRLECRLHPHKTDTEVAEKHEELQDVVKDYEGIQNLFHFVTANVFAYEKQSQEFGKAMSPLRMAVSESMRKRHERATLPFSLLVPRSGKKSTRPQQQQPSQKEW